MSVFNPTLETEIRYEQPVQAPRQFSPVAALADTATQALKVFESSRPTQASLNQAMVNQFGDALGRSFDIQQSRDNGKLTSSEVTELKTFARKFIESSPKAIPEGQRQAYEALTGESWDAVSFKSNEFYEKEQLLQSDLGRTLVASTKILNSEATSEQINEIVLNSIAEVNILKQQKALQDSRVAMGLPVDAGPVVESLRTDFSLLSASFSEFIKDGIVTQDEINSASTSVRALISGQYSQYEGNVQVKAVTDQMFGLVEDLRKFDTDANTLDAIHIALNEAEFNPFTISTIRAMIKENPMEFKNSILGTFEEKGKTWVDGLSTIMSSSPQENVELVDIFSRPPELPDTPGDKPAYLTIPSVKDNPEEYKQVLEGLGAVTSSTSKQKVLNNEDTRNTWLNSVNLLSSLVASQSDEYIMGDKLLSKFSNNQLVSTLEAIYQVDADNAAQTNDALQNALNSEYLRQKMEFDQRVSAGDEQYFMVDGDKLVLNLDFLRSKMGDIPQGNRRMAAIEATNARIEQVGGLEQFQKLPQSRRNEILAGSNLERILDTRFGTTLKLFNNLKMIDKKRGLLLELEKRYPAATQAFRGVQGDPELDAFAQEALSSVMNDDRIFSQTLDSLGPDQPQASEGTSISDDAPMAAMRAIPPSTEGSLPSPLGAVEVPSQEMPLQAPPQEMPLQAPQLEGSAPEVFEDVRGLTSQLGQDLPLNLGTTTSTEASEITRESQRRLKDIGFYRDAVDGISGDQTDNAIKTFQYENNLEVTGQLDENTRLKLAETGLSKRPEISDSDNRLLNFIGKGESGGYGAANDYNNGSVQFGVKDSYFSERYQKPLDKLTVSEIQDIQSGGYGTREVFAVGAYQIIPDTLNEAVAALGLTGNEVFDQALQDRIAIEYLAADKRPKLRDWLNGVEGVTREEAAEAFAQEWASVPLLSAKTRVVNGVTHNLRRGESYYKPEGNNADAHTPEELERLLDSLRS